MIEHMSGRILFSVATTITSNNSIYILAQLIQSPCIVRLNKNCHQQAINYDVLEYQLTFQSIHCRYALISRSNLKITQGKLIKARALRSFLHFWSSKIIRCSVLMYICNCVTPKNGKSFSTQKDKSNQPPISARRIMLQSLMALKRKRKQWQYVHCYIQIMQKRFISGHDSLTRTKASLKWLLFQQ